MTTIPWNTSSPSPRFITRTLSILTATDASWTLTALRLVLGAVMLPHGAQKLLGWFGGYGFAGTMGYFTGTLGMPWIFALAAILAETVGAAALLAGAGTRIAALGISANMVGATLLVHLPNGFFINWFGNQKGEGIEYFLLALALSLTLVVRGGGRFSADRAINNRIV
ncbi:MAG TPA: DoxX family protein [Thermoanaerobaculia bacterium]|nr:DoxX family protein [Thermoanaerobaculia bacterium]